MSWQITSTGYLGQGFTTSTPVGAKWRTLRVMTAIP